MEHFSIIIAGITLGFLHAFDVDHVAAVTAVVSKGPEPKHAASSGLWWALGHTITLAIVGYGSAALQSIFLPSFQRFGEIGVGIMLILVGIWTTKDFFRRERIHAHKHAHGGITHIHLHSHRNSEGHSHQHRHVLFLIGVGHGLAGSASVLAIVPITFLASKLWILLYILFFGLGTIIAMTTLAYLTGKLLTTEKLKTFFPVLRGAAGAFSILLGVFWLWTNVLF